MMIGCRPIKAQQLSDGSAGPTDTASGMSNARRAANKSVCAISGLDHQLMVHLHCCTDVPGRVIFRHPLRWAVPLRRRAKLNLDLD